MSVADEMDFLCCFLHESTFQEKIIIAASYLPACWLCQFRK